MPLEPDRIRGALLGVAVGDALGLPCENLRPATIARRFAPLERFRLFGGVGWISDDTEQTAMVAEAIFAGGRDDPAAVARAFARRLRLWFLLLPAGIGLATVRACSKLCLGVSASRSGVRSAGNGAAMRSVPIALAWPEDQGARDALAVAVARVTHTDPRGVDGARVVAHAAAALLALSPEAASEPGSTGKPPTGYPFGGPEGPTPVPAPGPSNGISRWRAPLVRDLVERLAPDRRLADALEKTAALLERGASCPEAARELGTTGFVVHTVPFALFCALRFPTFESAVRSAAEAGGDTDTIAAIAGGLAGCLHGASAIPPAWLAGLERRGRGRAHLEALAACFAGERATPPRASLVYRVVRAPFFVAIVLLEGLRRLVDSPVAIARGEWRS